MGNHDWGEDRLVRDATRESPHTAVFEPPQILLHNPSGPAETLVELQCGRFDTLHGARVSTPIPNLGVARQFPTLVRRRRLVDRTRASCGSIAPCAGDVGRRAALGRSPQAALPPLTRSG